MSIREIFDNYSVFVVDNVDKQIIIKKTNGMFIQVTEWKFNGKQELEYLSDRQVMAIIKRYKDKLQVR